MMQGDQGLKRIHEYYCAPRLVGCAKESIYEIWERGGAFNDSVTPATYSAEYRSHIVLKVLSLTSDRAGILSLGCGNGFVEAELARSNRRITGIDCNEEAVRLTRAKGVDAFVADFHELRPEDVSGAAVIYADGLLGHLFHPTEELGPVIGKLRSLGLARGVYLVVSNDSPRDPHAPFAAHEKVEGFWFISRQYLSDQFQVAGFDIEENYYFPYIRPVSGMRNRTICVMRAP